MSERGIDITAEFPKPWTDEIVRAADVVITMGCGDACPIFPGKRYEDWALDDPAGQDLEAVRPIRDEIEHQCGTCSTSWACRPGLTTRCIGASRQHSRHTDPRDPLDTSAPLPRRLAAEALGTGLLVAVVVGSGIAAQDLSRDDAGLQLLENALATAGGLAVIILIVSPVSSAHLNPVVTRRLVDQPTPRNRTAARPGRRLPRRADRRRRRRRRPRQPDLAALAL